MTPSIICRDNTIQMEAMKASSLMTLTLGLQTNFLMLEETEAALEEEEEDDEDS